jgi:HSP90 family molecular chaperone
MPPGLITVTDNGIRMTAKDLNDRFLYVGYRRRESGLTTTPRDRHVMGRKGIGKLSLFAITETVRVETSKEGSRAGLILRTKDIREQMTSAEGEYHPEPLDPTGISIDVGTRITLSDLRIRPTQGTVTTLRRRLARRFSIIGPEHN